MTVPRWPSLLLSALCLSGCAAGPPGEAVGRRPANDVAQDRALASLPAAAGRVVTVRRIPYANGFGQEIVLDGPRAMSGENLIRVQALTTASTGLRGQGAEELRLGPPTDTEVAAEMDRALPGVAMRMAAAPERGEDGTVGYATGAVGRLSCVYAWQYLAPAHPLTLLEGASGTGALPVSVRVRLCREGSPAAVVATLRGLRVSHPDGAAEPAPRPPAFGGDALAAAVGSPPPAAAQNRTGIVPADAAPAEPAPAEAVRPARRRGHRLLAARPRPDARLRQLKARFGAWIRPQQEHSAELAGVAHVPMPGEVSADTAPQKMAPAPAPRASAVGLDMPMPR